ncbi:TNF superfamily member 12 eiger isoform X2 [Haematobia irritans]|uniref:TNF superfamily member 12 eiger isoform X2 n=1 Tax=Haematobia irritans TaxID=7368 RepID=UPI003F4F8580
MTAETLKPFITPPGSVDFVKTSHSSASSVHHRSSRYLIAIAGSAFLVLLISSILGITIWNTVRISNLQTEVDSLNRVIESMQKRLGLTYLDDLIDLEKEDENNNALIDDMDMVPEEDESNSGEENDDDDAEDEDETDDDYTYEEMIKKFYDYEETDDDDDTDDDDINIEEDDDLYDDFEKFVDSTKKVQPGERKIRSITTINEDTVTDEGAEEVTRSPGIRSLRTSTTFVAADNADKRRSPMRLYNSRRRKFPLVKSAKTLTLQSQERAMNEVEISKPAVHFHLTHKISHHHSPLRINSYNGDIYIGRPSWTNERDSLDSFFHIENGALIVREPGLYYVYAQVCYNNHYSQNGFIIFHGHKPFLQCLSHINTNNNSFINTCHTSGLIYLKRDEHIHIRDFHADRKSHLEDGNNRSYFGLIKI